MSDEVSKVAGEVVKGLQSSPALLALLALNGIGIGAAVWFLRTLAVNQAARMDMILKACLPGHTP
jgi:hypothetical protein